MENSFWKNIREFNSSQNNAFEELVCQIARAENFPNQREFYKLGNPDGGVEAYRVLEDGTEYGWQAKYFFSIDSVQWSEIEKSLKRALSTHPRLIRYYVCLPLDFPDPRTEGRKSLKDRWDEKVTEWSAFARETHNREIEIPLWNSSELLDRLSRKEHEGRKHFWFAQEEFSDSWFHNRNDESIKNLGVRYSRDLNVELELSESFQYFSMQDSIFDTLEKKTKELIKELETCEKATQAVDGPPELLARYRERLNRFRDIGIASTARWKKEKTGMVKREEFLQAIGSLQESIDDIDNCLSKKQAKSVYPYAGQPQVVRRAYSTYYELLNFFGRVEQFAIANTIILDGGKGMGKSHLLASIVEERQARGRMNLFLLGQHFTTDLDPWTQILDQQLRLKCSKEEFLGALNTKAEAQGERIFFIIDAINEGRGAFFWPGHINGFINSFSEYPWLGLVMSIRTSFTPLLIPKELLESEKIYHIFHQGFSGVESIAEEAFFSHYGLFRPSIPLMHPEFRNPLFLKVFCQGLKETGQKQIPKGVIGFSWVIDTYIRGVNQKLSKPSEFHFSEKVNLVKKVIDRYIVYKLDDGLPGFEAASRFVNAEVQDFVDRKNFLDALISEDLFQYDILYNSQGEWEDIVRFAYERFEEHFTVSYLLDRYLNQDNPRESFQSGAVLFGIIKGGRRGQILIEALALQIPERIRCDLVELVPEEFADSIDLAEATLESLYWRKPETITESTLEYFFRIIEHKALSHKSFELLYTLAMDTEHPLNAKWLHEYLFCFSLVDRDALWTVFLHNQDSNGSAVYRLVDWSLKEAENHRLDPEAIYLAGIAISWIFASTNLLLRDRATHALVALLTNHLDVGHQLLLKFVNVNDPYITERLFSALYGATLRSHRLNGLTDIAAYFARAFFTGDEVYPNVLIRDYARNIVEYAIHKGLIDDNVGQLIRPPYSSSWPASFPTDDDIKGYRCPDGAEGYKDYHESQNAIIESMRTEHNRQGWGYGDFGRYTFQAKLHHWKSFHPQDLSNYACRLIFEKFGYDVEKHGKFDRHASSGDRHQNKRERIGKKYQWLALYEILARIADNHMMDDPASGWGFEKERVWFQGPWEPFARNIDPTFMLRSDREGEEVSDHAFPGEMAFIGWEGKYQDWLVDKQGLPAPESLIQPQLTDEKEWVALHRSIYWPERDRHDDEPEKYLRYWIQAYLVRSKDRKMALDKFRENKFTQSPYADLHHSYQIYYRELYWSPAHRFFDEPYFGRVISRPLNTDEKGSKSEFFQTCEYYLWESGSAPEGPPSLLVPSEMIFKGLGLEFGAKDGTWVNKEGEKVVFNAIVGKSNSALLIRKDFLLEFLNRAKLTILWDFKGEKSILSRNFRQFEYEKWLDIDGLFSLCKDAVKGDLKYSIQEVGRP